MNSYYNIQCRSGLVGVATGKDEIKFSSRGSGSVRSISFMHTERLVPVEEPPDDGHEDGRLQPTQTQQNVSNTESTKSGEEAQSTSDQNITSTTEVDESTEVCTYVLSVSTKLTY